MAHYIDYQQTDGSTPVATLNRVGSVKPDGTSINISADGTINCNGKVDLDAGNLSAEGKHNVNTLSFPSDRYKDLTLLASGQEYTAPANGVVMLQKVANTANQYVNLQTGGNTDNDAFIQDSRYSSNMNVLLTSRIPVKSGQKFYVVYNAGGTTIHFRFIYAEGEQ